MISRKVSVACKNPMCGELISPIKRRNNTRGTSQYCSRECYYRWSPGMDVAYRKVLRLKGLKENPPNPIVFMQASLKEVMHRFPTWTARAAVWGIKRQTFIRWLSHFSVGVK